MHFVFFFFKQKTAYEVRMSDWSSDVCSSDLRRSDRAARRWRRRFRHRVRNDASPRARFRAAHSSPVRPAPLRIRTFEALRSEEHTSELQSLMRISYAVFCLKKKKKKIIHYDYTITINQRPEEKSRNIKT